MTVEELQKFLDDGFSATPKFKESDGRRVESIKYNHDKFTVMYFKTHNAKKYEKGDVFNLMSNIHTVLTSWEVYKSNEYVEYYIYGTYKKEENKDD